MDGKSSFANMQILVLFPGSSGMWTLKLCRRREPGIFSHMSSAKGREGVERPYLCVGIPEDLEQEKEGRATYYTYLAIGGRVSYIPSVECKVCWITCKTLPFCFKNLSYFDYTILTWEKIPGSPRVYIFAFWGAWERGYANGSRQQLEASLIKYIQWNNYDFHQGLHLHMWQSRVEIEGYSSRISIALLCLKRRISELSLRVGLIRAS